MSILGYMHEGGRFRIVRVVGNRSVLDSINGFINDKKGHQKPLAQNDKLTEAIVDFYFELRRIEICGG